MAYEINIKAEDRKDAVHKAIKEFGIKNLVDTFYDWLDNICDQYDVNDFDDNIDIMFGGETSIEWLAALCVIKDKDFSWMDMEKKMYTLEEAREIIDIENQIKDIVFGKGRES